MKKLPQAMVIVDPRKEENAIKEAKLKWKSTDKISDSSIVELKL